MHAKNWALSRLGSTVAAAVLAVLTVSQVDAGTVLLGGGWQAWWDNSLDPFVSLTNISVSPDGTTITLRKNATFTQGPNAQGIFPSIPISFQQVATSNVSSIVIDDEVVTNSTGVAWSDFHFDLLLGGATFNAAASAGFNVAPFTNKVFSLGNTALDIDGGIVANGAQWTPGAGANGGQLLTNVVSPGIGTTFTLKETPTPGPTALMVFATGLLFFSTRRRIA